MQEMLADHFYSRSACPACSRVLWLRGLPYRALDDDIKGFFAPLAVTKVHICKRGGEIACGRELLMLFSFLSMVYFSGRATGEAYVQFGSRKEAGEAMIKNYLRR